LGIVQFSIVNIQPSLPQDIELNTNRTYLLSAVDDR